MVKTVDIFYTPVNPQSLDNRGRDTENFRSCLKMATSEPPRENTGTEIPKPETAAMEYRHHLNGTEGLLSHLLSETAEKIVVGRIASVTIVKKL